MHILMSPHMAALSTCSSSMYVCMYTCIHKYLHTYICILTSPHMAALSTCSSSMYVCIHVYIHTDTNIYIHTHAYLHLFIWLHCPPAALAGSCFWILKSPLSERVSLHCLSSDCSMVWASLPSERSESPSTCMCVYVCMYVYIHV